MTHSPVALAHEALAGNRRSLARLLTAGENEAEGGDDALALLYPRTGRAHIIGVTGAPGSGKSTLVAALTRAFRALGSTVGIIAVDPTSPFSGGAILGDRIRMRDLSGDSGVFIRSMATRGTLGGLAAATRDAARVLDATGCDVVLIETVGAGQNEVEIARMAQTTLVVEAPGMGDEIQAIKAGILEIADILIVNKADRPGASNTVRALRTMIETGHPAIRTRWMHHGQMLHVDERQPAPPADTPLWIPPIIETVATEARGIDLLLAQVQAHRQFLLNSPLRTEIERTQMHSELLERLRDALAERLLSQLPTGALDALVTQVLQRQRDPGHAVAELIALAGHPVAQTR